MPTDHHLRRGHDDPYWSGRLVEGSDHGWDYEDCHLDHMIEQLEEATEIARELRKIERREKTLDEHGVVHADGAQRLAYLFETVDNLQRYLPWADAWCTGYMGKDAIFRPITAHLTYDQACNYKMYVEQLVDRGKIVYVERYAVPVLMIMHPNAIPARFVSDIVVD